MQAHTGFKAKHRQKKSSPLSSMACKHDHAYVAAPSHHVMLRVHAYSSANKSMQPPSQSKARNHKKQQPTAHAHRMCRNNTWGTKQKNCCVGKGEGLQGHGGNGKSTIYTPSSCPIQINACCPALPHPPPATTSHPCGCAAHAKCMALRPGAPVTHYCGQTSIRLRKFLCSLLLASHQHESRTAHQCLAVLHVYLVRRQAWLRLG